MLIWISVGRAQLSRMPSDTLRLRMLVTNPENSRCYVSIAAYHKETFVRKVAFLATILLLVASLASPQTGQVVSPGALLAWDYDTAAVDVQEFRVYLSATPGVVPSAPPTAVVAFPALQWPIQAPPGQWYAVVTAVSDAGVESAPSNEFPFFVELAAPAAPQNLRAIK